MSCTVWEGGDEKGLNFQHLVSALLHLEGGIRKRTAMYLAGCLPYQKNRAVVRQVVGYDRFVGELAYRQLTELYRALRLYVNCFQPRVLLRTKQREESQASPDL
jgi:hypothetical protein